MSGGRSPLKNSACAGQPPPGGPPAAPAAAAGGPLALVRTGDGITLDVPARTLALDVPDDELAARRAARQIS